MLRNKSAEFNHIYDFFMNLNDKCDMSYDGIKDLKITGGLDYYFESNGIDKDFKTIIISLNIFAFLLIVFLSLPVYSNHLGVNLYIP